MSIIRGPGDEEQELRYIASELVFTFIARQWVIDPNMPNAFDRQPMIVPGTKVVIPWHIAIGVEW